MSAISPSHVSETICPFCSLLCDDVLVTRTGPHFSVDAFGCKLSETRFCNIQTDTDPSADLKSAVRTAAGMIARSKAPVVMGMMTDVAGTRAALQLADRIRAVVLTNPGTSGGSNLSRVQRYGGYLTTLTEIRNRADLIILLGDSPLDDCPRILDAVKLPAGGVNPITNRRSFAFIGGCSRIENSTPSDSLVIDCKRETIGMVVDAIRLRVEDRKPLGDLDFIPNDSLDDLTGMMTEADYPVFIWSESDFSDLLGDLATDSVHRLIESLNVRQRCAGLVLSDSASAVTVRQVATWQYGKPTPLGFRKGTPLHAAGCHSFDSLRQRNDVDLIIWVGGLEQMVTLPRTQAASVVISPTTPDEADLHIPVGVPGIHHDAHLFRTDNVVAMHIRQIIDSALPSSAGVLKSILSELAR